MRNAHKIFTGKSEETRQHEIHEHRWDAILKRILIKYGVVIWIWSSGRFLSTRYSIL